MGKAIDITNQIFGRLTAIKFVEVRHTMQYWLFECSCGNRTVVRKHHVKSGVSRSCGCYQREKATTHGMRKTRFYRIWAYIQDRCYNPNYTRFKNYGGRGIKCLWKSFEEFKDDMYESYENHIAEFGEKQTSIDRRDNNGNYCKSNCRWTTYKVQNRNKRNNKLITYKNQTQCLAAWSEDLGIPYARLQQRLGRLNWSIEKALSIIN